MSSKKSPAARLLTAAVRVRATAPARRPATKPAGALGGRLEQLEDRVTPALKILPAGLTSGDQFYVMFVTDNANASTATSTNIATYDATVSGAAAAATIDTYDGAPVTWRALGSTTAVSAVSRFNPSVPVYRMDGTRIADNGADLWDGTIAVEVNYNETGVAETGTTQVWTGTNSNGTAAAGNELGASSVRHGLHGSSDASWVSNNNNNNTQTHHLYAFSSLLTVAQPPAVSSISRGTPAGQLTNAAAVSFTVTFDQPVFGVTASDFAVSTVAGGPVSGTVGTPTGGGTTWTVPVTGLSHAGASGEFRLDLIDDSTIVSTTTGFPLGGAGAQNYTAGQTYILDQVAPTVAVTPVGGTTTATPLSFTVTFNEPVSGFDATDVTAAVSNGTAGTVSVTGGPSVYTVTVPVASGYGTVSVSVPAGRAADAAGNPNTASNTGTVTFTPLVNLSVSSNTGTEAGATAITVTATSSVPVASDQTVSLAVAGTNVTAGDYTLSSATITILSGNTSGSVTFTVANDALLEGTETATLSISAPSAGLTLGATTTQNVTITDNESATLAIAPTSTAAEGGGAQLLGVVALTITGTAASGTFAIGPGISLSAPVTDAGGGSATGAGTDYAAFGVQTVTFNAGATTGATAATSLTVTDDLRVEGSETVNLALGAITVGGGTAVATTAPVAASNVTTITDNDTATLTFDAATSTVTEDNQTLTRGLTLTLSTTTGTGTVALDQTLVYQVTSSGSAANGGPPGDYSFTPTTLTFSPGTFTTASRTVSVAVFEDLNTESAETIILTAAPQSATGAGVLYAVGTPGTHTITITDDDSPTRTYDATVAGDYRLVLNGTTVELYQGAYPGTLVAAGPLGTSPIVINGVAGAGDRLTVDYSGGNPVPAGGLTWNGGTGGSDALVLSGGATTTQTFNYTNAHDGSVVLTGTNAGTINYTGLEPISSTLTAAAVVLNYGTTGETITVTAAGAGQTTAASTAGETTTFVNPTGLFRINAGAGDDTIDLNGLGGGFAAALAIDGQADGDVVNLNATLNIGAGDLTVTGETINSNAPITTTGAAVLDATGGSVVDGNAAALNFQAASAVLTATGGVGTAGNPLDLAVANLEGSAGAGFFVSNDTALTIGGIGPVTGVSVTGGDVTITAGSIVVDETVTNSGGGAVSLRATGAGSGVVGGSTLLSSADVDQLAAWLGEGPLTLTNIFTKTTTNGLTSFDFHAAADGQGRTFSVMEVLPTNGNPHAVIGGYNPQSWSSTDGYHVSPTDAERTAFIFNLTTSDFRPQKPSAIDGYYPGYYQTYNTQSYGPTFGGGHDIYVEFSLSAGYSYKFSYGTSGFNSPNIVGLSPSNTINYGIIEVFTIAAGGASGTGDIAVRAPVTASGGGAVNLTASGAISETGAGLVGTTGTLTTQSAAGTTLGGANAVGTFNATNTTSGDVTLTNTAATLTVSGIAQTGGAVDVSNAGDTAVSGAGIASTGGVQVSTTGSLTVSSAVASSAGAVALRFGQDGAGRSADIDAPVTGTSATLTGGAGNDTVRVTRTGATVLDVSGNGVASGTDQVTVVVGALGAGYVRLNNPGAGSENYRATVDGAAQSGPLTFHANTIADEAGVPFPTASGVRRVGVNAATVLDYGPAGATLTELSLLGGTGADSYFVQFTDTASNALSLLPQLVNVTAGGAADAARVYGTNNPDTIAVNAGNNDRVTSAGVGVQYDGSLEALTVYGKGEAGQPGDTFAVRPDQQTALTVGGGSPLVYPGDTLDLDLTGLVTLSPTLSDPALPDGTLALPGYGLLSWTSIENIPVPRGLGGSFDFGPAGSPVQFGFTQVLPSRSYPAAAAEGTGWHGWATTPQYGNQAYAEANLSPALAASPLAALLSDYAYGFGSPADYGVFRVDVAPNKPVQLTAVLGTPAAARDGQVVEWGVANSPTGLPTTWTAITPAGGLSLAAGEMSSVSAILTAAQVGNNQSLFVRFRDVGGEPYWSVSALDVRPTNPGAPTLLPGGLVAPLPVRREYSTDGSQPTPGGYSDQPAFAAVAADGATIDYYRGKGAIPGSLVTITATSGTPVDAAFTAGDTALATRVLNGDPAGYLRSIQVQADANGEFTFGVRRPTGTATSTVTVTDPTGFRAGAFTQAFALPSTRRIDFGPLPGATSADYGNGGTVGAGYIPFAAATYTDAATNALGWATGAPLPVAFTPGGTGATAVQADGVFGGYAPSEFVLDMPSGSYVVTATLGDLSARRDDLFVEVFNGTSWVFAKAYNPASGNYDLDLTGLTSPAGVSPNAGQSMARTFLLSTTNNAAGVGQLRVRFGNVTGDPNWSLSALDVRPAQAALTITRTSPAPAADGTTVSTYTVTGAAEGTVLTVRPALGSPAGSDGTTTYDGFQVVVPASGTATFSVTAPFSTTAVNSIIEVESVSGAERGMLTEGYAASPPPPTATPAVRRFDFDGPSNDTSPAMTGVRGNQVWTAGADAGWLAAVGEFERATSTLPASMTAAQKSLFRDGATSNGATGTFRVKVSDAGADYVVRYYVGDSYKKWPWIRLQVEGGTASGQLATNVNQYWSYVMTGYDANGDGYLDVSVFGSATWVLNAIDVAKGTTAAALPPSLFAPSPQAAAFTVTSGTAPKLTDAALRPIVAEAVSRWAAAGADPARLAALTVSITDLNDVGRLGEHVPGSIHIDDDAGGRGWFVDPTPADDAEFGSAVAVGLGATDAAAARGVDLLTVVMHELGHELGLDDVDPAAAPADLMAETLDVGVRRLPAGLTVDRPVVATDSKAELPARPATVTTVVALPTPALWLDEAETVYSPGVAVAAADDRVRVAVAPVEPVKTTGARADATPALASTPAWPDADALLGLDGVYVD